MDLFAAQQLQSLLNTEFLGRNAILLVSVDSTNSQARRGLADGLPHGAVFIAGEQTGGRGRRGRQWVSEPGCGLWMTVVLEPFMAAEEMQKLTLLIGLAVCRAVESLTGYDGLAIKWPNDVLAEGKKLCGILCESALDQNGKRMVIAGVGVNTRTPTMGYGEAALVATSIEAATGRTVDRLVLAAAILGQMEMLLDGWQTEGFAGVAEGYRRYMLPEGTPVVIMDGQKQEFAAIEGLDDDGALLVRLQTGGMRRIISGEISVRGVIGYA